MAQVPEGYREVTADTDPLALAQEMAGEVMFIYIKDVQSDVQKVLAWGKRFREAMKQVSGRDHATMCVVDQLAFNNNEDRAAHAALNAAGIFSVYKDLPSHVGDAAAHHQRMKVILGSGDTFVGPRKIPTRRPDADPSPYFEPIPGGPGIEKILRYVNEEHGKGG